MRLKRKSVLNVIWFGLMLDDCFDCSLKKTPNLNVTSFDESQLVTSWAKRGFANHSKLPWDLATEMGIRHWNTCISLMSVKIIIEQGKDNQYVSMKFKSYFIILWFPPTPPKKNLRNPRKCSSSFSRYVDVREVCLFHGTWRWFPWKIVWRSPFWRSVSFFSGSKCWNSGNVLMKKHGP